jgi:uncharacterized membrane protein
MDFTNIADSAVTTMSSAASSAGPAVVGIAGLIVAVGVVISLIKKAK